MQFSYVLSTLINLMPGPMNWQDVSVEHKCP